MQRHLERLALNPLESGIVEQEHIAREHYALLVGSADAIAAKLDRSRSAELAPVLHLRGTRLLFFGGTVASAGLYRHIDHIDEAKMPLLDANRRAELAERVLRQASLSSRIEVEFDVKLVRDSLAALSNRPFRGRAELLATLFSKTQDESLRLDCLDSLRQLRDPAAGKEFVKLARSNAADPRWRRLCLLYAQEQQAPMKAGSGWSASSESGFSLLAR